MRSESFDIAIVGSWHQSTVLAACFAEMGHHVRGIADEPAVAALNAGHAPLYEPGLDDLLRSGIGSGRLRFTHSFVEGLQDAQFAFISIDTPVLENDESDLGPIWSAVDALGGAMPDGLIVVVTSQLPVGSTEEIGRRVGRPVAYVPEFLRLGTALDTFRKADRFVIGADDEAVRASVADIYSSLGRPIHFTSIRTAEMSKHASNAFLATSVSFINQIADLCEKVGADVVDVAAVLKMDRRIGPHAFLSAGLGFAGGTLGREVRALQKLGRLHGVETDLFEAVEKVNRKRVSHIVGMLESTPGGIDRARIAVLGLTYKSGTSTLRRSASLALIRELIAAGATVTAYDALARPDDSGDFVGFEFHHDAATVARGATAVLLMAPWPDRLNMRDAARLMSHPMMIDTGNYVEPRTATEAGFDYRGVGR